MNPDNAEQVSDETYTCNAHFLCTAHIMHTQCIPDSTSTNLSGIFPPISYIYRIIYSWCDAH